MSTDKLWSVYAYEQNLKLMQLIDFLCVSVKPESGQRKLHLFKRYVTDVCSGLCPCKTVRVKGLL